MEILSTTQHLDFDVQQLAILHYNQHLYLWFPVLTNDIHGVELRALANTTKSPNSWKGLGNPHIPC